MEEAATTTPRNASPDTDLNTLLYVIVAAVIVYFVMSSKRNREPEVVIPPTKEELKVIRERRAQAMSRKFLPQEDGEALLDGSNSEATKGEKQAIVGKAHEKATAVSKSAPMPPTTTEKDTTTLRKPQNSATVEIVDTSNEGASVPVEDSREESTPIVEERKETATTQAKTAPLDSEMKRKQVAQASVEKEASTETMADEKKAPVNKKASESRLLQTNGGPKAEQGSKNGDENPKALMKDPPPVKKRPRRTLPPPQLASDILSSITKQEIVVTCDGKEYRPRKNAGKSTVKVSMEAGASLDSVQLPRLPKQFRDIAAWYARAYATSRNGYPPHVSSPSDAGYEAFQSMLTTLMDRLVQKVFDSLQSDQTTVEDDDDDEDDLFSDYMQPAQQQQESGPILSFLALLEETPSIVGRPFLESLLKKSSQTDLASMLLHRALQRLDNLSSLDLISKRSNAVSVLLQSPTAVKAWAKRFQQEAGNKDKDAKDKEATAWLKPLLQACAHCIPEAGAEQPNHAASLFRKEIERLDKFPVCIYDNRNKDIGPFMQQVQLQMQSSRNVAELLLRKGGKDNMFRWLGQIIQSNDAMGSLLRGDLLATNGVAAVLASRSFLLGLASAVVNVCCESLTGLFEKDRNAFDYRYLQHGRLDVAKEEHMLVQNKNDVAAKEELKFSGGTEFFFLVCGLLRISLYPALRIEGAFHQQYQRVFSSIQQAAQESKGLPPQALSVAKSAMAALMGWSTYLDDPKLVSTLTKFSILQLQWVLTQKDQFELIPEWMLKNPATWLARIARTQSRLLKPYQATVVVEVATQLLQLGTKTNDERALSPVVIDHLVKIIAAFVSAGVNKARQRQRRRGGDDDRDASIYLSFDANDLGVTVFTNKLVATELCPTLMQTFGAVDVVEGLDVDREHGFDKFSAKGTIAELILRLWSHPNGECRASITKMDGERVAQFAKETVIATGVLFDFSCNRMADICNGSKRPFQSQQDRAFLEGQGRSVCSELTWARLWIMTLCKISEEPKIRKILGNASVAKDLAALIIHLVDILTDPDGGIHPNLDFAPVRSSELATKVDSMDANEKQKHAASISKSRYVSRVLYGLDVSLLCHQFLAMLSGWHKAARDSGGLSPILKAFAAHDDYEEGRYRNILRRLITESSPVQGTEAESAAAIFEHDGYVDTSPWEGQYKEALPKSSDVENQIRSSKKDQMSHEEMRVLASMDDMKSFLDDAESYKKVSVGTTNSVATIPPEKLDETVDSILAAGGSATAETYAEQLSDWVVTSESFASKHDPSKFAHYYDSTVRTRGVACSGKTMVKEARRCHKNLPVPHPNSAAFCCFAEERMDLCRACITGPVDTPYALGIFLFEVFFPANYPTIPPLVTFMTTGGGQTRFNPNLYSDGKVCLSLLGTFHAQDESQKWNPGYSSLGQILLSIQTQLLVEEPYFNEPGNEARRGTPVGTESANRYNLVLKLATLRHAIISPLKEPPVGLEEICLRHFSLCRGRILVQAQSWMKEAQDMKSTLYPRFQRSYAELVALLAALGNDMPSLPPSEDEKAAKKAPARGVIRRVQVGGAARQVRIAPAAAAARRVRAAPAQEVTEVSLAAALMTAASVLEENPWANPGAANVAATSKTEADEDDELYE